MHLLNSCRSRFNCVPVVHEVAAGIATEYFNEAHPHSKAFALVTAGPGLTNIVTAIAGAWLEHRELLVIGGQAKSSDLLDKGLRQRGIQEIDGATLVNSITKHSIRVAQQISGEEILRIIRDSRSGRPGPVFLEMCLDVQGAPNSQPEPSTEVANVEVSSVVVASQNPGFDRHEGAALEALLQEELSRAERPCILIGAGVTRKTAGRLRKQLAALEVPIVTTWHGADRYCARDNYFGRMDTWGQRAANLIVNQSDLLLAFGARLGLQETGFNHQEFVSAGKIIQIEIDRAELQKGHPNLYLGVHGDANVLLEKFLTTLECTRSEWLNYCKSIRKEFPLNDPANITAPGFVSPYKLCQALPNVAANNDVLVPSSSGGSNSTAIQALENGRDHTVVSNCGLASMGYGLSGAIGAAFARPDAAVWLLEGDGGFCQNLQELATVAVNNLNIKMLIYANDGYGSIRTTQRNYFEGAYVGCDINTGLGFPSWKALAEAFSIPFLEINANDLNEPIFPDDLFKVGPRLAVVPMDPDQTYWPKITSRVTSDGSMQSAPTSDMSPTLTQEQSETHRKYL